MKKEKPRCESELTIQYEMNGFMRRATLTDDRRCYLSKGHKVRHRFFMAPISKKTGEAVVALVTWK